MWGYCTGTPGKHETAAFLHDLAEASKVVLNLNFIGSDADGD
jgi:hypothetical protein